MTLPLVWAMAELIFMSFHPALAMLQAKDYAVSAVPEGRNSFEKAKSPLSFSKLDRRDPADSPT